MFCLDEDGDVGVERGDCEGLAIVAELDAPQGFGMRSLECLLDEGRCTMRDHLCSWFMLQNLMTFAQPTVAISFPEGCLWLSFQYQSTLQSRYSALNYATFSNIQYQSPSILLMKSSRTSLPSEKIKNANPKNKLPTLRCPYFIFSQLIIQIKLQPMENEGITSKKNTFTLPYENSSIQVSGNFDSGNLNSACINLQKQEIELVFGKDKEIKPSSKTWFHFYIQSESPIQGLKLYLLKVNTLSIASKVFDLYRPVVRLEGKQWQRHASPVDFQITAEGDVNFKMTVDLPAKTKLYIALCYPWSFTDNEQYLERLEKRLRFKEEIYFNKEVLVFSPEKRPVHLVAISSSDVLKYPPEKYMEHLFPDRSQKHFREIHKPLILITSRVHPGEIGSSYALNGLIDFLISDSPQAVQLRSQFYFMIIPMLNPDGVFNGNNRMDSLGQNLNRFYHLPDLVQQPSCYAVKSLVENTRKQLFAFFDFHGHANKKSCFLFGNFISNARQHAQSVLFAKYLSTICEYVEFKTCNFSKKQMSSRDKNEDLSKQGCARVVVHRWSNSPYCYTLETGLFKNVKVDQKGIVRYGQRFYSPQIYEEVGMKILLSFSAILKKNKEIDQMRKFCVDYVSRLQKMTTKKEKLKIQKVPKSLKSLKSLKSQDGEGEELSKKSLQGKQNEQSGCTSTDRVKQISLALLRNKGQLLNLNEDQDDQ